MIHLIFLPVLMPLVTAILLIPIRHIVAQRLLSTISTVAVFAMSLYLLIVVHKDGIQVYKHGDWLPPFGITMVADLLSAGMLAVTMTVAAVAILYSLSTLDTERERFYFHPLFHFLLMGVNGTLLTGDIFNLFVFFEVMLIASYGLVALGGAAPQLEATIKYASINLVGTTLMVAAVGLMYGLWGTLNMADLSRLVTESPNQGLLTPIAMVFLMRGFIDALMMRAQQAIASGGSEGYLPPHHFAELFTGHGTMMIFFMGMPFLIGLMNIAVPTQIGARDVAYPYLNAVSLWLTVSAGMLVMASLAVGHFSDAGWTGYAPYSGIKSNPGVGVDYWIWALQISGIGTTITGINFFVTIMKERAPGMNLMRMPMFTWTSLCTNILMVLAFPALTVVLALLSLDRYVGTHFFTSDGGGNQMMFVNMFWVWGHPEVYILILPAFGVFSEVTATFSNKRLFGYASLVYATMVIALLSFTVWVHHFFTMGQDATRNSIFAIATMIIGVPTGVKIYDWLFTMFRGRIRFNLPILWTLSFIITFTIGGMTGVMLAIPGIDFKMHNGLFVLYGTMLHNSGSTPSVSVQWAALQVVIL